MAKLSSKPKHLTPSRAQRKAALSAQHKQMRGPYIPLPRIARHKF